MKNLCGVGLRLEQLGGREKVTGAIEYAVDVVPEGAIWGVTVRSPYPHARVRRVDAGRARALPGVCAVITAADIPDRLFGRALRDQPVLAREVVRFVGEKVAGIAANDLDTAEEAARLVAVEYEELPAVFDPEAALRPHAPLLHPSFDAYEGRVPTGGLRNTQSYDRQGVGDVEAGFRAADVIVEGTYQTAAMHQLHLEPHATVVEVRPDGSCIIWTSNKMPYTVRRMLAALVGIREEQVLVVNLPVGGDFGAKACIMDEPLAYYLSRLSGRPVKMVMTPAEELMAANPRHGSQVTVRLGATKEGRLTAMQVRALFDGGAYCSYKPLPIVTCLRTVGGPYRIPNTLIEGYCVYTNTMPRGYMRGPGGPQVVFPFESTLDELAGKLGLDPVEIRRLNAIREGDLSVLGEHWLGVRFRETLDRAVECFAVQDHKSPGGAPKFAFGARSLVAATPAAGDSIPTNSRCVSPTLRVGIGVAACSKHIGGGISNVAVEVDSYGTVTVISGVVDPGTGALTMLRQVVAEELQVPIERVRVKPASTDEIEFESGSAGSRLTRTAGTAAQSAARATREVLNRAAADILECPEELLVWTPDGVAIPGQPDRWIAFAKVAAVACERYGSRRAFDGALDEGGVLVIRSDGRYDETGYAEYPTFSVVIVEVAVDMETGEVRIVRAVMAQDVGTVVNPMFAEAQLQGGMIQSLGIALTEELCLENGRVTNPSLGEYKVPTAMDVPPGFKIELVEGAPGPGPFNAKGLGDICIIPGTAAIANAVSNALGLRVRSLPIRPETIVLREERRPLGFGGVR